MEFPLDWDGNGSPVAGFRPDFYLPRRGVFIELTTADQRLVTRKNRKVRRMRELYPEVPIIIVYQRDFASLIASHGLLPCEPPSLARWTPTTAQQHRCGTHRCMRRTVALGAKMVPFGGWEMPLAYPSGTVAEHRACRTSAVAFDVSHLGTVRVQGPDAFGHLQHSLSNDLSRVHPGPGPVHPPPRRGRVRRRRHHRVVGRRGALRRDAQRLEHHRCPRGHRWERRDRPAGGDRGAGARGARPLGSGLAGGRGGPPVRRRAVRMGGCPVPGGRHGLHRGGRRGMCRAGGGGDGLLGRRAEPGRRPGRVGRPRHTSTRGGTPAARP